MKKNHKKSKFNPGDVVKNKKTKTTYIIQGSYAFLYDDDIEREDDFHTYTIYELDKTDSRIINGYAWVDEKDLQFIQPATDKVWSMIDDFIHKNMIDDEDDDY